MKKLAFIALSIFITSGNAFACPACMGSSPNDKYYLWVIGAFILLIYFPMFYLFKTIIRLKNINNTDLSKHN